ncbi:alpha-L-rhamnosidase [Xylariaceae sp. FL0804]|nr:alpha-L-rhamnosidase [Xylariaceae sp. FL0804]
MSSWRAFLAILANLAVLARAITVDSEHLRCNGLATPLGLATTTPRLSWIPLSSLRQDTQTAYQLQASIDPNATSGDLWDTGKVSSTDTSVIYAGEALHSRDRVYWRVRAWDKHGKAGSWSPVTWFELALMQQSDWTAQWITNEQYVMGLNGLPTFLKAFSSSCSPQKARLYMLGLGVQWAALNGKAVTDEVLMPSYSTINKTLFYSSYDVTHLLNPGENTLVLELGKGVYDAYEGLDGRYTKFVAPNTPRPLSLVAQLEYQCASSHERRTVNSDSSWKTTVDGPYLEASWYGGYEYDARRELPRSASSSSDNRTHWQNANTTTPPYADLHPQLASPEMPPLKVVAEMPCKSATNTGMSHVFDFEQNFAGWYTITFQGTRGSRIIIWPAERLLVNGSADQSTTGSPIFDGYTFSGVGNESFTPKFMYHGFRYLEIYGLEHIPSSGQIVGHRIQLDAGATGSTQSSVALFNSIHDIIQQAIQNNIYSVLTDCPTREKLGWLDQDHLAIDPVLFGFDLRGFGRHMMKQMRDAQNSKGNEPTTAPQLTEFGSWADPYSPGRYFNYDEAANWGISIVLFALKHYETYGDIEILRDSYSDMQAYVQHLTIQSNTTYIVDVDLGDWIAPDQTTPFGVTGTAAYALGAQAMVKIASALGRYVDAAEYASLHRKILYAFHERFLNRSSGVVTYGSGSQCCDAIALSIGAVPSKYQEPVYQHLISSVRANGTHFSVGEVGLPPFFQALSKGHNELLYEVMSQTTSPSYGYQVVQGATSLTEDWDGPTGSGSQDHLMLGHGDAWLYGLAGMQQAPGSVGWRYIDFEPILVGDVAHASTSFLSVQGLAAASWERIIGGGLQYNLTVPVGSEGIVRMAAQPASIKLDGQPVLDHPDVLVMQKGTGMTALHIGSGRYDLEY